VIGVVEAGIVVRDVQDAKAAPGEQRPATTPPSCEPTTQTS
jgi:hypothetical protein